MAIAAQPKQDMFVYRQNKWQKVKSFELVPGDVCSIVRLGQGTVCPCDMLLLSGTCVVDEAMLTGESTHQPKESIRHRPDPNELFSFSKTTDKIHILYGGTTISKAEPDKDDTFLSRPPDGGCIAFVLRTGFYTSQGKLMRTILYASKRVTADTGEALAFIGCLTVFGLIASGYVFYNGIFDETRSKYRLMLSCIIILTSSIPPELPTELSLAVRTSLNALRQFGIFCTEPFRIPSAGKTEICCFDKTGTLTSDLMILEGVAGIKGNKEMYEPTQIPELKVTYAIAGCHALMFINEEKVGDPMELASLEGVNWAYNKSEVSISRGGGQTRGDKLKIIKRFHFHSEFKRMSTVVVLDSQGQSNNMILATTKGAPEVLKNFFHQVPSDYDEVYEHYSRMGRRVLAVGYKVLPNMITSQIQLLKREDIESHLIFGGFLVFKSVLKADSFSTVSELINSSHQVVMITGDNTLTACQIAAELAITQKPVLVLTPSHTTQEVSWVSIDQKTVLELKSDYKALIDKYDLCVFGDGLVHLMNANPRYLPHVKVWARVSPQQKEEIVLTLKNQGYTVLMCGDGTNDVGALKQAHVGVALLMSKTVEQKEKLDIDKDKEKEKEKDKQTTKALPSTEGVRKRPIPGSTVKPPVGGARALNTSTTNNNNNNNSVLAPKFPRKRGGDFTLEDLMEDENTVVRLGDACIASSFTLRGTSISPIISLIRQGRCTLVATIQIFKILALNCLIQAYSLSVLYYDGVRMGDRQATLEGILIAFCFLAISISKPQNKLSKQRPLTSWWSFQFIASVIGQFLIHFFSLIYIYSKSKEYDSDHYVHLDPDMSPIEIEDVKFRPTLINSAVFMIGSTMRIATFATNYEGHPFMQSLTENKPLFYVLGGVASVVFLLATEVFGGLNSYLELVPLGKLKGTLLTVMAIDFVGAFVWDRIIKKLSHALGFQ